MRVLWSQACFHSICFNGSEPVSVYVCSVCRGGGGEGIGWSWNATKLADQNTGLFVNVIVMHVSIQVHLAVALASE